MSTTLRLCLALGLALQPIKSTAETNVLPDVPLGGLVTTNAGDCTDPATGERGHCQMRVDTAGNKYLVFLQDGEVMFIRQIIGDGFTTLYTNDRFNSY